MHRSCFVFLFIAVAGAQSLPADLFRELHWRNIGPFRGGRTRAAVGVPVVRAISRADPEADPARLAFRALITEFSRHRKARRIAFQTLVAEGFGAELEANMDEIARALATRTERIIPGRREPIPAVSAFVLTRAANGVLVSAANERFPHMGTAEFKDELVRLVRGFLNALPASQ